MLQKILKWFNIKNKIRLLDFSRPQMILIHNFHKGLPEKCAQQGIKCQRWFLIFNSFIIRVE